MRVISLLGLVSMTLVKVTMMKGFRGTKTYVNTFGTIQSVRKIA